MISRTLLVLSLAVGILACGKSKAAPASGGATSSPAPPPQALTSGPDSSEESAAPSTIPPLVGSVVQGDACLSKLPARLVQQLKTQFPDHRPPLASDNFPDDIAYYRGRSADGCLGATVADFDGNGSADFAVLLTSSKETTSPLVVARASSGGYTIDTLRIWTGPRAILYVNTLAPGRYERTRAGDSAPGEPGELRFFNSPRPGIATGAVEGGAVAYFYDGKRWVHVWISD